MTQVSTRIIHSVIFKLKHPKGSLKEKEFLAAAEKLSSIPGVENFQCLRQVSPKNEFEFGLSMEFANQPLYDQYSNHPEHIAFVQQRWMNEVEEFLEIDYQRMG